MTGMYNALEKLRAGETLTDKERTIHEQGLVSVLKQFSVAYESRLRLNAGSREQRWFRLHRDLNDLDAAVFEAYGWPVTLTDEEILERLVALNAERAAKEQRGQIHWLRPDFQNPSGDQAKQKELAIESDDDTPAKPKKKAARTKKLKLPSQLPR